MVFWNRKYRILVEREAVRLMQSGALFDRLAQVIGFLILVALTVALLLAAKERLLPYQQDDDAFDTVFAYQEPESGKTEPGGSEAESAEQTEG